MNDYNLRQLFYLCKDKNKFVYEVCDIFGDRFSVEEAEYWSVFSVLSNAHVYNVDISNMSLEDAMKTIERAEKERNSRWTKPKKGSSQRRKL